MTAQPCARRGSFRCSSCSRRAGGSPLPNWRRTIANAVWRDRQLRLSHERRGQLAQRTVHPLGLVHKTGAWYLVAVHRARVLAFRVDRVGAAKVLDAPTERPVGFDLQAFWSRFEQEYAAALPTFVATVRLGPRAQRYRDALGAAAPRNVVEDAPDGEGWIRQRLTFDNLHVATSALLALAPDIEVLDPPALRDELLAVARAVLARHGP